MYVRLNFPGMAWPEVVGGKLLRAPANAVRDVTAIEAHLAAIPVDAPDDQVGVGVVGVVVIDGGPFEAASEVAFHPCHEAPDVIGEVKTLSVLGRDDEPELMTLAVARLGEDLPSRWSVGAVEDALGAVLLTPARSM